MNIKSRRQRANVSAVTVSCMMYETAKVNHKLPDCDWRDCRGWTLRTGGNLSAYTMPPLATASLLRTEITNAVFRVLLNAHQG
jgi:hypothetical protein